MEEEERMISVNLTGHEAFLAAGQDITNMNWDKLWLGAYQWAETGKWLWKDGSSAEAFLADKWDNGRPKTQESLAMSTFRNFSMFAYNNKQFHYVCEIDVLQ